MLGGFEIAPQKGRQSSLYVRSDFEDSWGRYAAGETPSQTSTSSTSSTPLKNKGNSVEDKTGVEDRSSTDVEGVEDRSSTPAPSSTKKPNDINTVEDVEDVEVPGGGDTRTIRVVV